MRKYQSHKVVEAGEITGFGVAPGNGHVLVLNDAKTAAVKVAVPDDFFARGWPKAGDYLVRYQPDGYLSFSPGDKFKAGYTAVDGDTATDPPLNLLTNQELARIDLEILRIGEVANRTQGISKAREASEEQYKARQRLGTLVLDIVERLCADRVAASTITHDDGTIHTAKTSVQWMVTAKLYAEGESYYRDIVDRIGHLLGDEVRTTDTGEIRQEVLRAKVYEVAERRLARQVVDRVDLAKAVATKVMEMRWASGHILPAQLSETQLTNRSMQVANAVLECMPSTTTPVAG